MSNNKNNENSWSGQRNKPARNAHMRGNIYTDINILDMVDSDWSRKRDFYKLEDSDGLKINTIFESSNK